MALELSGVRRVVERLLEDELQLWRDLDGHSGDQLDEQTGELKPAGHRKGLLWEGPGAITRPGQLAFTPAVDGTLASLPAPTVYQALVPISAPRVLVDDELMVSRSPRDGQLVGRRFRVVDVGVGSYVVVRVLRLESVA